MAVSSADSPPVPASLPASAYTGALSQNIAHRGFRARFPENSIEAFVGALDRGPDGGGAEALETDVHLTRDGVVVLSHDPTLKRCFGWPERLADCDWEMVAPLRTTQAPHVPMARLSDLLALLAEPENAGAWTLLDIKRDDPPEELLRRIAETVAAADGDWRQRIVIGCWNGPSMRAAQKHLPGFRIAYIGFSLACAETLLRDHANVVHVFNLLQAILMGRRGARFLAAARAAGHPVLVWTVNEPEWMAWSIRHGVDGVITDDPAVFGALRRDWEDAEAEAAAAKTVAETPAETPAATGTTPLQRTAVLPTPHPPASRSFSGLHIRRWTRLYTVAGLLRGVVYVFENVMWWRLGPWRTYLQKELKGST